MPPRPQISQDSKSNEEMLRLKKQVTEVKIKVNQIKKPPVRDSTNTLGEDGSHDIDSPVRKTAKIS